MLCETVSGHKIILPLKINLGPKHPGGSALTSDWSVNSYGYHY